mmetsp:Transcript_25293/g.39114  ORF Transcript_25293/g.39114 Transcript_25293/m.39114 type:complete len:339 (+) Transcript_25293:1842-2858(+)|eukprot:CAMPEP_0170511008 /NCGR_PEP_ID=MMETSP0208-20121228/66070_1 /TAXON_ID=197538 /ORGANISM="Strombidium inclinatum, Strain S3" /LENGTH=338 /DNA_ID=CAMNT_0010794511 /DNA_START=2844 /DNA_END=3860 /DNA_ORIENTATION=-
MKALVSIEKAEGSTASAVLIQGNTFSDNAAVTEANVLEIRQRTTSFEMFDSEITETNVPCGGIKISNNEFKHNGGCRSSAGAMHLYCYITDLNSSMIDDGKVTVRSSFDSQYYTGDLQDEKYKTFGSTLGPATSSIVIPSEAGAAISVDPRMVELENNRYEDNLIGEDSSVVLVEGFPVFISRGDHYLRNHNWLEEAFNLVSPLASTFTYSVPSGQYIDHQYLETRARPSQSLITVTRAMYVEFYGTDFHENLILSEEATLATNSHGFLISDFVGTILLDGGTDFKRGRAISESKLLSQSVKKDGITHSGIFGNPWLFRRFRFTSFFIDGFIIEETKF